MLGDGYMNFTGYPSIDNIHNKDYTFGYAQWVAVVGDVEHVGH